MTVDYSGIYKTCITRQRKEKLKKHMSHLSLVDLCRHSLNMWLRLWTKETTQIFRFHTGKCSDSSTQLCPPDGAFITLDPWKSILDYRTRFWMSLVPAYPFEGRGGNWSQSELRLEERWGTRWTNLQSIKGPTYRDIHLTFTLIVNLESPTNPNPICMYLDCGRKLEYLEKTHGNMMRTCKLHTGWPWSDWDWTGNLLPKGHTTAPENPLRLPATEIETFCWIIHLLLLIPKTFAYSYSHLYRASVVHIFLFYLTPFIHCWHRNSGFSILTKECRLEELEIELSSFSWTTLSTSRGWFATIQV